MKLDEMLGAVRETLSASRVFGTPVEQGGVTVIPAAVVYGGGGGGTGLDGAVTGDGAGLGMFARPIGAFVIQGGTVRWVPAIDVTRLLATVGAIAVGGLFAGARIIRALNG